MIITRYFFLRGAFLFLVLTLGCFAPCQGETPKTSEKKESIPPLTFVWIRGEPVATQGVKREPALEIAGFLNLKVTNAWSYAGGLHAPWQDIKPYPYPVERAPDTGARFCHVVLDESAPAFFELCLRSTNDAVRVFAMKTAFWWYHFGHQSAPRDPRTESLLRKYSYVNACWEDCIPVIVPYLSRLNADLRLNFWDAVLRNFGVYHRFPDLFADDDRYSKPLLDMLLRASRDENEPHVKTKSEATLRYIAKHTDLVLEPADDG